MTALPLGPGSSMWHDAARQSLQPEHPSLSQLKNFSRGLLEEAEIAAIGRHLQDCGECCDTLETLPEDSWCDAFRDVQESAAEVDASGSETLIGETLTHKSPAELLPELAAVKDKYQIIRLLGEGGMGRVFHARHKWMPREVAIKVVRRQMFQAGALESFRREADAIAKLDHPGIVRLYDADQVGDCFLLVMEYVAGSDLQEFAKLRHELGQSIPVESACGYIRQALDALQHAFEHKIVHRDLKPRNLLLTAEGAVKIADFGIAKLQVGDLEPGANESAEIPMLSLDATRTGALLGTLTYVAPEQLADPRAATIQADIYGLGGTLYFLLSGRAPQNAAEVLAACSRNLPLPVPTPLREIRDDLPDGLYEVVARMMHVNPRSRYATPAEAAQALLPFTLPQVADAAAGRIGYRKWLVTAAFSTALLLAVLAEVYFQVRTKAGWVEIEVNQPDVQVWIDDSPVDRTRIKLSGQGDRHFLTVDAISGQHELELRKPGFRGASRDIRVETGRATSIHLSLTPEPPPLPEGVAVPPDPAIAPPLKTPLKNPLTAPVKPPAIPPAVAAARLATVLKSEGTEWKIERGDDGDELVVRNGTGEQWLIFGDQTWTDYDFSFEARHDGFPSGITALFRSPSDDKIQHFGIRWLDARTDLIEYREGDEFYKKVLVDGKPVRREGQEPMQADRWYQIKVVVRGKQTRCYSDGDLSLEWDENPYDRGRVGVRTWRTWEGRTRFRNLLVTTADGAELWKGLPELPRLTANSAGTDDRLRSTLSGHTHFVWGVAFSPDGQRLLSGSQDGTVKLWDVTTAKLLRELAREPYRFTSVAWSPDGKLVAACGDHPTVKVWDAETGALVQELRGHESGVRSLAISPDSKLLASGSYDKTAKLWDLATGKELLTFRGHTHFVFAVAFSPDGKSVASGSWDHTVKVWEAATGVELQTFTGFSGDVLSVAFSPLGNRLAASSQDGSIRIWNWNAGIDEQVLRDPNHLGRVFSVVFSPDGAILASGSDRALKLWNPATGEAQSTYRGYNGFVFGVAFSPDGRRLASAHENHSIMLWEVPQK